MLVSHNVIFIRYFIPKTYAANKTSHTGIGKIKQGNNYYHVTYAFQSESKLYSCLNVEEFFALNRRDI